MPSEILYRASNCSQQRYYFEIEEGKITVFWGAQNTGKSSLARMLLGLSPVNSGSLTFSGAPIPDFRSLRTKVQAVFPDPHTACSPMQTIREQFCPIGRENLFAKALKDMGLAPAILEQRSVELCPGNLQRVHLARIQAISPQALIADDPLRNIPPSDHGNILEILKRLRTEQNMTIVVFTRSSALANQIGNQIFPMSDDAIRTQENLHAND